MRAALAIACALAGSACSKRHAPAIREVRMHAMQFEPATLEVSVGDTVMWTNADLVPHTATATGVFDSKSVEATHTWSYTATTAGTFPYGCTFHPTMKGTLIVK